MKFISLSLAKKIFFTASALFFFQSVVNAQLSGTYTIDPKGSGSSNFVSFTKAVDTLKAKGVSGAVIFNIADGLYKEHISIPPISGASTTNTITFQSKSKDSSKVKLYYDASTSGSDNYVIQFTGGDYITFKQITIEHGFNNNFGNVIIISNGSSSNNFLNNVIRGSYPSSSSYGSSCCLIFSLSSNDNNNRFAANLMKHAPFGFYYYGSTSGSETGTQIEGNKIDSIITDAIRVGYCSSLTISKNRITNTGDHGIIVQSCTNHVKTFENYISMPGGNGYGIYYYDCSPTLNGGHDSIYNNIVISAGTGILLTSSVQDVVFNSVEVSNAGGFAFFSGIGAGVRVYNNIFSNSGGGAAFEYVRPLTALDNNQYYSNGAILGYFSYVSCPTLSYWQGLSSLDSNSISANPYFTSATDLTPKSGFGNNNAKAFKDVPADYYGKSRGQNPDIGAIEFTPSMTDISVKGLLLSSGSCGDSFTRVGIIVFNAGPSKQTKFHLYADNTGIISRSLGAIYNDTLEPGQTDTFFFLSTFNTTIGGKLTSLGYISLTTDNDHSNDTARLSVNIGHLPGKPSVTKDSICGGGIMNLRGSSGEPGANLLWYDSSTATVAIDSGKVFKTPFLTKTRTYYVEALSYSHKGGLDSNNIGPGSYAISGDITYFNVYKPLTIDSVAVFANKAGNVKIELLNGVDQLIASASAKVKGTGKKEFIKLNFVLHSGNRYQLKLNTSSTTASLFWNNAGAKYPYSTGDLMSITGNGTLNTYYFFFYDFHISFPDCPSLRIAVVAKVLDAYKSVRIGKGYPFTGTFNEGTASKPDEMCSGNTLTYNVSPPAGDSSNDFNKTWKISWLSVRTPNGTVCKDTSFTLPDIHHYLQVHLKPSTSWSDSILILSMTVKDVLAGCDTTLTRYIRVHFTPQVNFGFHNECERKNIPFYDSSHLSSLSAPYIYFWNFGDGKTSSLKNPSHSFAKAGVYNVSLKIISNFGCTDSTSKQLIVYPVPKTVISSSPACLGRPVIFSDSLSFLPDSNTTAVWDFGDSTTKTGHTVSHIFKNSFQYNISLKLASSHGCSDSTSKAVRVYLLPSSDFSTSNGCSGLPREFIPTSNGPGSVFIWDFGDGGSDTSNKPSHIFTTPGKYKVLLTTFNGSGCSDTVTHMVVIFPAPNVNFTASEVCEGNNTDFMDSTKVDSGYSISGYSWNFGDGYTSSLKNPSHKYGAAGTYNVSLKVTVNTGCEATKTKAILVKKLPNAAFVYDVIDKTLYPVPKAMVLSYSYFWDFGDGQSDSGSNVEHSYISEGSYVVRLKVVSSEGCSATYTDTVIIGKSNIKDTSESISLSIFPNPFKNSITLSYTLKRASQVTVIVYDINCQPIITLKKNIQVTGVHNLSLPMDDKDLKPGIYAIRVMANEGEVVRKVIRLK